MAVSKLEQANNISVLRIIRKRRGLRTRDVAAAIGVPLRSYQHYESGAIMPRDLMGRFAKVADCDPIALFLSYALDLPGLGLWSEDNKSADCFYDQLNDLDLALRHTGAPLDISTAMGMLEPVLATLISRLRDAGNPHFLSELGAPAKLTSRQLECLSWVQAGKSSGDIGQILGLSARTVDGHLSEVCERLGVRTRVQAVARAIDLRLLSISTP